MNTPWLKVVESCDDMKSAANLMRRKAFGPALAKVPEDGRLSDYEDALDRHYYAASSRRWVKSAPARFLKQLFAAEIDHTNISRHLGSQCGWHRQRTSGVALIPGGRLVPKRAFSSIATGGRSAVLVATQRQQVRLRLVESALEEAEATRSLDSVVTWMNAREHAMMQRMSYLHPYQPSPSSTNSMKVQEVSDLRLIVRGRLAGLSAAVLEAHLL